MASKFASFTSPGQDCIIILPTKFSPALSIAARTFALPPLIRARPSFSADCPFPPIFKDTCCGSAVRQRHLFTVPRNLHRLFDELPSLRVVEGCTPTTISHSPPSWLLRLEVPSLKTELLIRLDFLSPIPPRGKFYLFSRLHVLAFRRFPPLRRESKPRVLFLDGNVYGSPIPPCPRFFSQVFSVPPCALLSTQDAL